MAQVVHVTVTVTAEQVNALLRTCQHHVPDREPLVTLAVHGATTATPPQLPPRSPGADPTTAATGATSPAALVSNLLMRRLRRNKATPTFSDVFELALRGVGVRVASNANGYRVNARVARGQARDLITADTCYSLVFEHGPELAAGAQPPPPSRDSVSSFGSVSDGSASTLGDAAAPDVPPLLVAEWASRLPTFAAPAANQLTVKIQTAKLVYAQDLMIALRRHLADGPAEFVEERRRRTSAWLLAPTTPDRRWHAPAVFTPDLYEAALENRPTLEVAIDWRAPVILVPHCSTLAATPVTVVDCGDISVRSHALPLAERLAQRHDAPRRLLQSRMAREPDELFSDRWRISVHALQCLLCSVGSGDVCVPLLSTPTYGAVDVVRGPHSVADSNGLPSDKQANTRAQAWARSPGRAGPRPVSGHHRPRLRRAAGGHQIRVRRGTTCVGRATHPQANGGHAPCPVDWWHLRFSIPDVTLQISEAQVALLSQQLFMFLEVVMVVPPSAAPDLSNIGSTSSCVVPGTRIGGRPTGSSSGVGG